MNWDLITDAILLFALAVLAVFACLGLYQWISRKSLKKVDRPLLWMLLPLTLMTITYLVFDHLLIWNTRPNGSGEPSFPSSHVMAVTTIFLLVALILPRYVKTRAAYFALDISMLCLIILICVGRVLANMHWISDVIGALVFSAIFAIIYYLTAIRSNHHAKHLHQNH